MLQEKLKALHDDIKAWVAGCKLVTVENELNFFILEFDSMRIWIGSKLEIVLLVAANFPNAEIVDEMRVPNTGKFQVIFQIQKNLKRESEEESEDSVMSAIGSDLDLDFMTSAIFASAIIGQSDTPQDQVELEPIPESTPEPATDIPDSSSPSSDYSSSSSD